MTNVNKKYMRLDIIMNIPQAVLGSLCHNDVMLFEDIFIISFLFLH